ncbi:phosphoadenosine phosphosulfate reductase family protein [Bacteroides sp.]|uniref:phosphoadenosine phosphosulfate reductase family protein n=1 Tax=Bacteroides sp. TaxID=29523 RepID=UPI002609C680|nr:phosphoadenosine phosphosulfate reductase family protein [Bacteroides sp.]
MALAEQCLFEFEELEQTVNPKACKLADLSTYDKIIVSSSGGKDSEACALYLLELGIAKDKIILWHQSIDGSPGSMQFADWPVTEPYVRAFGEALGIRTEFQWRENGFIGEILRENQRTNNVQFEHHGNVITLPTRNGKYSTRRKFPAKAVDLRTRWCTAYLKIDVMKRVLNNHPDFQEGNYLVITGERREESANRARYLTVEKHPCERNSRKVTWWRSVIEWSEKEVWDILEKYRILPHPAYWLGFSRTSCFGCIFCTADQWATVREVSPERFNQLVEMEKELNHTIDNKLTLTQLADRGRSRLPKNIDAEKWVRLAIDANISPGDIFVDRWDLPTGAFTGAAGGPC